MTGRPRRLAGRSVRSLAAVTLAAGLAVSPATPHDTTTDTATRLVVGTDDSPHTPPRWPHGSPVTGHNPRATY